MIVFLSHKVLEWFVTEQRKAEILQLFSQSCMVGFCNKPLFGNICNGFASLGKP